MADFHIDTALQAIRERRTEDSVREQEQRNTAGRGRLTPNSPGERVSRAMRQERELWDELKMLRKQPNSELKSMRLRVVMDRIAELAAEQGDWRRAAKIAFSPLRRHRYKQIYKAIQKPDDETCDCEDDRLVDRRNREELDSPAVGVADTIVTPDGEKRLDRCRKCGFLNAR